MTEINQYNPKGEKHGFWKTVSQFDDLIVIERNYINGVQHGLECIYEKNFETEKLKVVFVNGIEEGESIIEN